MESVTVRGDEPVSATMIVEAREKESWKVPMSWSRRASLKMNMARKEVVERAFVKAVGKAA